MARDDEGWAGDIVDCYSPARAGQPGGWRVAYRSR